MSPISEWRTRAATFSVAVALILTGCAASEPPLIPQDGDDTAAREATAAPCQPTTTQAQEFVPAQAEPIEGPPGAGEPEEERLNEEFPPPVPDSDAPLGEVTESVFAPPRGAEGEERPEDPVVYVRSTMPPHGVSPQVEPEVAAIGERVLMTWNFNAGVSNDGGSTFEFLSPRTTFPDQSSLFWGDQRAEYSETHDLWMWVLMYKQNDAGTNIIRLGVAPGDSVFDGDRGTYYDWTSQNTGFPSEVWFDQPKLATTDTHAFLALNAYGSQGEGHQGALVIRLSLDALASGSDPQARCFLPGVNALSGDRYFSPYPTRGGSDTMYFATHHSRSALAVWRWRDDEDTVSFHLVADSIAWPPVVYSADNSLSNFTCRRVTRAADGSLGMSPATSDWCLRLGDDDIAGNGTRITSGWVSQGQLGFAWNIPAFDNPDRDGVEIPYPAVWVVLLDEGTLEACGAAECIVDHPWLMNTGYAIQYAAIAPNARGDLGAIFIAGGGSARNDGYLTCTAAIRDQFSGGSWHHLDVEASDIDVPRPSSGDYLGIWPDGGNEFTWSAGCMTYQQGVGDLVHFARFGRRADIP